MGAIAIVIYTEIDLDCQLSNGVNYTIGFNGTTTNTAYISTFNQVNGGVILGKAIDNVHSITGGTVQDFERGSIFAYGNKTVAVTGSIATYYRANSASLGLPVSEESTTSYGKFQDFSNGKTLINSAQFGTQVLQRQRLGQAKANEVSLGTDIWKQDFQNGTIFHGPKGSYLLVGTLYSNYYNVLSDSDRQRLGMPIGNETSDGGWHQSFENGVLQLVSGAPVSWNNNSQTQTQIPSNNPPTSNPSNFYL